MALKAKAHPTKAHKYQRFLVKGAKSVSEAIYRCMHPGCPHYLTDRFIKGAIAECWRCGSEFVITKEYKKPHCDKCTRKKVIEIEEETPIPESPI